MRWHARQMVKASPFAKDTYINTSTDVLYSTQVTPLPKQLFDGDPFDVIIVDGPSQRKGRTQPIYAALRLAQMYSVTHFTHVFVHDASREEMVDAANKILGHNPQLYVGNYLPRKGLKHWRIPGQEREFTPPIF